MAYEEALKQLRGEFGDNFLLNLEERGVHPHFSTGSLLIDEVLGIGGVPRGRVTELFGPESAGKTTLAFQTLANCQNDKKLRGGKGGRGLILDFEQTCDLRYMRRLGVLMDKDHLIVHQPDSFEQGTKVAQVLMDNGAIDMLIIDSIAAMAGERELDAEYGVGRMEPGYHSRLVSQAMKQLLPRIAHTEVAAICINQLRTKISMRGPTTEETTGGRALKHYASIRLELRKIASIKGKRVSRLTGTETDGIVGLKVRANCVKNKLSSPFAQAEVMIMFGEGFDNVSSLLEIGKALGRLSVDRTGWVKYGDETLGRGIMAIKKRAREEADFMPFLTKVVLGENGLAALIETPFDEVIPETEVPVEADSLPAPTEVATEEEVDI